jgi:recombination protein RecT
MSTQPQTQPENQATKQVNARKNDITTVKGFEQVWQNYEKTVSMILQSKYGITPQEFMISTIQAVRENPKLLQCNPKSLFGAILQSAQCGLKFNTPLGHAYIIPYKGEAQFQIGYQGLIEIMYRNPRIEKIDGRAVYSNDIFDYGYGLEPYLNHKPARSNRGELTAVYCVCKLFGSNTPIFTVVEKDEINAIKNLAQAKDSKFSPYNNGTDVHNWMQVKTSVKKISKLIPKTFEIANIIDIDNKTSNGHIIQADILQSPDQVSNINIVEETAFNNAFDGYEDVSSKNNTTTPTEVKQEVKSEVSEPTKQVSENLKPNESFEKKEESKFEKPIISESKEVESKDVNTKNSSLFDE